MEIASSSSSGVDLAESADMLFGESAVVSGDDNEDAEAASNAALPPDELRAAERVVAKQIMDRREEDWALQKR